MRVWDHPAYYELSVSRKVSSGIKKPFKFYFIRWTSRATRESLIHSFILITFIESWIMDPILCIKFCESRSILLFLPTSVQIRAGSNPKERFESISRLFIRDLNLDLNPTRLCDSFLGCTGWLHWLLVAWFLDSLGYFLRFGGKNNWVSA